MSKSIVVAILAFFWLGIYAAIYWVFKDLWHASEAWSVGGAVVLVISNLIIGETLELDD